MDRKDDCSDRSNEVEGHAAPDNPVYRRDNPNLEAECIFFYHLQHDPDTRLNIVTRYFVDRERPVFGYEMPDELVDIMNQINEGRLQPISTPPNEPVICRRKSYLACVLDVPHARLEAGNAVTIVISENGNVHRSFRDGKDIPRLPTPYRDLSAFFCINHMRGSNGRVIGDGESETYKFTFNHIHTLAGLPPAKREHEDSSTNLGPPRPPPP